MSSGDKVGDIAGIAASEPLHEEGTELGTVVTLDRLNLELKRCHQGGESLNPHFPERRTALCVM